MTDIKVKSPEETIGQKPIIVFGKDVREIHCFRKSCIYGICAGVVGGLATFLFTSKASLSTQVGLGTVWIGVLGYWVPCRYNYETTVLKIQKVQKHSKNPKTEPYSEVS